LIIGHIAKAVSSKQYKDSYNLFTKNCQHFASKCVFGVDFSKDTAYISNIGRRTSETIKSTNEHFANLTFVQEEYEETRAKIQSWVDRGNNEHKIIVDSSYQTEFTAVIEMQPNCFLFPRS